MSITTFRHSAGGIDWYCESTGTGPQIVLIPSGEGDCSTFANTMEALSGSFSVLTFDTPGFSRSGIPADFEQLRFDTLGAQVAMLVRSLGIEKATFYGCSSGARAVLDIALNDADLVRNALVHEVALPAEQIPPPILALIAMDDEKAVSTCRQLFAHMLIEDSAQWNALGDAYHSRLARNYLTWVRRYLTLGSGELIEPSRLKNLPLAWTVGSLSDANHVASNLELAATAGLRVNTLFCRHFPQVTIPAVLAAHIAENTAPFLA